MNRESQQTLRVLARRALQGLFEPLCAEVSIRDVASIIATAPTEDALVTAIGFCSPGLSGELVLVAPAAFVEVVLPPEVRARAYPERIAADWVGELANQLVGRLKNQLLGYGVDVTLGTPRRVIPADIDRLEYSMRAIVRLSLSSREGTLLALLFAEPQADLALAVLTPGVAVSEGDIVLF